MPKIDLTDDEWRARLTPEQFQVMRCSGTECSGTSPLNDEERAGVYHCVGCESALFTAETKFHSGSGWPSFFTALPNAVTTHTDRSHYMVRTEVKCATCDAHLGHVFEDGPPPTGLRFCINGVALAFVPKA